MIIGSNRSFLYAIKVNFSQELLSVYEKLIDFFYSKWFKIFYVDNLANFPIKEIEQALELLNVKRKPKDAVDFHSFMVNYKLWRTLNVKVPSEVSFPLPRMTMTILFINVFWNSTKGLSNTIILLLDSCEENLGICSPQSVAGCVAIL